MPTNKDFKRLVRGRMQKTGESYTAARAQLLKHTKPDTQPRVDYAKLAGMTPDWWSQTVSIGYERIKGLRAIGQRRGGRFETSKSKTFAVPLARLYRAFSDARTRARWLPDVSLEVRTARALGALGDVLALR